MYECKFNIMIKSQRNVLDMDQTITVYETQIEWQPFCKTFLDANYIT